MNFFWILDQGVHCTPFLLFGLALMVIGKRNVFFYYYVGGFLLNYLLNLGLKTVIKQPRPDSDVSWLRTMETHGHYVDPQLYGMPSGHAQESFFSLLFVYGLTQNQTHEREQKYIWIFLLLCFLVMCHRVLKRRHTVFQVLVGAVLGSVVGYGFYELASQQIKGKDTARVDDGNQVQEGFAS